jgi:hypothetical protein
MKSGLLPKPTACLGNSWPSSQKLGLLVLSSNLANLKKVGKVTAGFPNRDTIKKGIAGKGNDGSPHG